MGVFIHPLTDWGFKRIFGDKELLIDFLNSLLEGERVITDLSYLNTESQPVECKDISLVDKYTGKVFNNKFRQIYIELPRFMKPEADCDNFLEYWIYNLVNMDKLKEISFKDKKAIFDRLERIASQANLSKDERARLDEDWKNYNDFFNTMDYAKEEGRAEQNLENARNFKALGVSTEIIMKATGLSEKEIENL